MKTNQKPNKRSEGILKILDRGDKGELKALFSFDDTDTDDEVLLKFNLWSRYCFHQYFKSEDAPFHKEMDAKRLMVYRGKDTSFLNIAFRDSAKTTRAKLFRAFVITNDTTHFRRYFRVLSKDISNSKQSVTDIYNMLITPVVKTLYPEVFEKTEAKREETMASFTTATGIKVVAETIGTDQRGAIQDDARPDFDWYDDFETRMSLMSAVTTHKIWENMEEARTGLAKNGASEYTANYISERGNVHKLIEKIENKMITPIETNGEPTWKRFTRDDLKKIKNDAEDYEGEYLCKPSASKDVYFDRESLDRQVAKEPIDEIAGLKIFRKYRPSNRVASGHDVGGGVGLDSSTSVFMDFDCVPIQVIATYKNNEIRPDAFAHVIAQQGKKFGENYVGVEKNYGSTLDILKTIYPANKIHKTQRGSEKISFVRPIEYGWDTNSATKPKMLADFSKAIEDGLIELNDKDLIVEARSYTLNDLMDNEIDPRLATRHWDLLMAACICWQMNSFVKKQSNIYEGIYPSKPKDNPAV